MANWCSNFRPTHTPVLWKKPRYRTSQGFSVHLSPTDNKRHKWDFFWEHKLFCFWRPRRKKRYPNLAAASRVLFQLCCPPVDLYSQEFFIQEGKLAPQFRRKTQAKHIFVSTFESSILLQQLLELSFPDVQKLKADPWGKSLSVFSSTLYTIRCVCECVCVCVCVCECVCACVCLPCPYCYTAP